MRRKHRERPAHAEARAPRAPRVLPMLLGALALALAAVAGVSFLMPELMEDLVPRSLDLRTVGIAAAGAAVLTAVLVVASVLRGRRRTAEREFSRPQLTTVAALTPEEEAAERQVDEASPLLPEPPSLPATEAPRQQPVPAGVASAPVEPVQTPPPPQPPAVQPNGARPSGSGVHIFEANRPRPSGNGASPEPSPEPAPAAPRADDPFAWIPRHTEDGQLLVAESWSFGSGRGRRRRR